MSTGHVGERERDVAEREREMMNVGPEGESDVTIGTGTGSRVQSPERDGATRARARYPINSRRLTATHLRALAEALGLPRAGSADQVRQCIEGKLQTEREDPNVVVIVRELQTTAQILALADSEGEFVETSPLYCGPATHVETASQELQEVRAQLQEAEAVIESARSRDEEQAKQIADLHASLRGCEQQVTQKFEEVAELKQQITAEKKKARQSWKTNCEHLAEQDALITAKEEEIENLKQRLTEHTVASPARILSAGHEEASSTVAEDGGPPLSAFHAGRTEISTAGSPGDTGHHTEERVSPRGDRGITSRTTHTHEAPPGVSLSVSSALPALRNTDVLARDPTTSERP